MAKYKVWQTGPGAVTLSVCTLRPVDLFRPRLDLTTMAADTPIAAVQTGDLFHFELNDAQVATLRTAPTSLNPPSLSFYCSAVRPPAAVNRKWGWAMRVSRAGVALPVADNDGTPLKLDADGFVRVQRSFPESSDYAAGLDIITLA